MAPLKVLLRLFLDKFEYYVKTYIIDTKNNSIPFLYVISLTAQINKIEPPFGMLECKILSCKFFFYGENIATYDVTVSNEVPIIDIKKPTTKLPFVTITTKNIPASDLLFTFKKQR
jgi:hypothetical protein